MLSTIWGKDEMHQNQRPFDHISKHWEEKLKIRSVVFLTNFKAIAILVLDISTRLIVLCEIFCETKRSEMKSVLCEIEICALLKHFCEEASTNPLFNSYIS